MTRRPTDGPIASTSKHREGSAEANYRHIGSRDETSRSQQSALVNMAASSTNATEPCAERPVERLPNSAVGQSRRTRCTSSLMLGEFDSWFSEVPWANRAPSHQ